MSLACNVLLFFTFLTRSSTSSFIPPEQLKITNMRSLYSMDELFFFSLEYDEIIDINEDNSVTITLEANDPDGDALSVQSVPPGSGDLLQTLYDGTLTPIDGNDYIYDYSHPDNPPGDVLLYKVADSISETDVFVAILNFVDDPEGNNGNNWK